MVKWKTNRKTDSRDITNVPHHQLTLPVQKISNSRHIRDVACQVKTMTRNSKMAALLAFIA